MAFLVWGFQSSCRWCPGRLQARDPRISNSRIIQPSPGTSRSQQLLCDPLPRLSPIDADPTANRGGLGDPNSGAD
jgi:hypothetical protein